MTIEANTGTFSYTGNGVTTAFPFPARFLAAADIVALVYVGSVLQTAPYSVSGANNPSGGSVTFTTAPALNSRVVLIRDPAVSQLTHFENAAATLGDTLENTVDKLTMIAQRHRYLLDRTFHLADSSSATPSVADPVEGNVLVWGAGARIENIPPSSFGGGGGGGVSQSYVDAGDAATLAASNTYTDNQIAAHPTIGGGDFSAIHPPAADNTDPTNATSLGTQLPNPRLARTLPRDQPLSIFWWIAANREYGIRNGTDLATCQTAIASALASGENIFFPAGRYHITDQLAMSRQAQIVKGAGKMSYPGSWMGSSFDINYADFNMSAASVFKPYHECQFSDFAFDFSQPTITNVSQIKQYPWALDLRDSSRGRVSRVRINRGWDGINGIVAFGTNTGGANTLHDIELGCFRYPFYFDAFSGDFLELDNIRAYVFGFADRPDLLSAYYGDGSAGVTGYCNPTCVFGQQDGLTVGAISMWMTHLVYQNGSSLHGAISSLNLDGGRSSLEVKLGNVSIGNVVSLNNSGLPSVTVNNAVARCQIGNCRVDTIGQFTARGPIELTAGSLQIGSLQTKSSSDAGASRHILQTGGDLMIGSWRPSGVINTARATPMFEQTGGRAAINYFRPEDKGTGSGNVITATIDDFNYFCGHLVGWSMAMPTTQNKAIINIK